MSGASSRIQSPGADAHANGSSGYLGIKGAHTQSHSLSGIQANANSGRGIARSSVDAARPNLGPLNTGGMGSFGQQATGAGNMRAPRPSSELLQGVMNPASPETEAMDRWFTDLQHYETTLEEMAAASLDQNFKEELTAIEQWFRVLTESERTAALYSLLQTSTQMQIRFFITVLQQMARADPFGAALLSPTNATSMEQQMEQRLSQLNFKSPAQAGGRQYGRASLGVEPTNFLSPNTALLDPNDSAAIALAAQRAKLSAHRISAPGTLLGANDGLKSPIWQDAERGTRSPSPVGEGRSRPKSTGSDISNAGQTALRHSMLVDDTGLSPMPAGSWASMVNTPLVPMFQKSVNDDDSYANVPQSPNESTMAQSRLGWGSASTSAAPNASGIVLDDARKFRRTGRMPSGGGLGSLPPMGGMGAMGSIGASSTTGGGATSIGGVTFDASGNFMMPGNVPAQGVRRAVSGPASGPTRMTSPSSTQSSLLASQQQAAALAAQQSWRASANGLLSSGNLSAGPGQTSFNSSTSSSGSPNPNVGNFGNMTPQELATYNMTSLLLQQQQQQLQLQQNMLNLGMANNMGISPNLLSSNAAANQMALAMNNAALLGSAVGNATQRRSPRTSDRGLQSNKPAPVPGSGANPDEQVDDALLGDVSAWLRSLRLHKYTTNFEGVKWQDMVKMDDAALERKGVSALGARRKLLKVFEVVRLQKGIDPPPGSELTRALSPGVSSTAGDSSIGGD